MLLVTDHAKLVLTIHFNAPHALTTLSAQTEDASQHAPLDNISMLSQEPADNAHQLVLLVAQNNSVPPVQTIKSFQLEDNACHVFTHVPTAQLISASATSVKADSTFSTETVSEAAHQEPDQSMESAHALQDWSWMVLALPHAHLDSLKSDQDAKDANLHALNAQLHPASVLTVWIHSFSDQTLENVNRVHHAIMVRSKLPEGAQEFVALVFTSTMELASLEDAQVDSRTMDSEDVSVHQLLLEDVIHQLSD